MTGHRSLPKANVEEINVKVNENTFLWSLAKEDSVKAKIEEVGSENELFAEHIKEDDGEDEENASFIEFTSGKEKVRKSKRPRKGKRRW